MPFWLPQGTVLLELIEAEVREQLDKRGYEEIKTPQILDEELWHRSGHWDNYVENMYFTEAGERQLRAAADELPGACLIFGAERHSYRELPLRLAEFGQVFRNEREGVLHGLLRVRAFTQDDAHVYCTEEQITDEVTRSARRSTSSTTRFGFEDVRVELSTRPEKSIGTDEQWERAEAALREALEQPGPRLPAQPRRRRLLRAEDRLPRHRRARALLAVRNLPARLLHARALRSHLHRRRQRRAPAGDDPPRAARLDGALRRRADRALRAAASRSGWRRRRRSCCRSPTATTTTPREVAEELRAAGVRVARRRAQRVGGPQDPRRRARRVPYMLVVGDQEEEAGKVAVRSHEQGDWEAAGDLPPGRAYAGCSLESACECRACTDRSL